MLSQKARYALRALIVLAEAGEGASMMTGDLAAAAALLQQALETAPEAARPRLLQAELELQQGHPGQAYARLQAAMQELPAFAPLMAGGLARRCLVQLAYAIGVVEPVSVMIDTYGTGSRPDEELEALVRARFRLTSRGIIESLGLERAIYAPTASYGHFGRTDVELPWEKV